MANLTITATGVLPGANARINHTYVAGEAVTAGQSAYLKPSDSKLWLAQCDGNTDEATIAGICLNGAAAGQPVSLQEEGDITIGATVVVGATYVVSATAGGICPVADLATTNKLSYIGYGISATQIRLNRKTTGIALP